MKDLTSFVPTLCELMNVPAPSLSRSSGFSKELNFKGEVKKALIYCPDAFGRHALNKYPEFSLEFKKQECRSIDLFSVFPSVTPVCFASLFTGALPCDHGISSYQKPVLKCDTLFDALLRSGKKVAIVAVKNSSIDLLFKDRDLDYYSLDYDPLVSAKALELIELNQHDVIVVYHQEYDDLLHETGAFSELSQMALDHHMKSWSLLLSAAKKHWKKDYCLAFTPDHGGHDENGHGDHGLDIPADMELTHFFYLN